MQSCSKAVRKISVRQSDSKIVSRAVSETERASERERELEREERGVQGKGGGKDRGNW